MSLFFSIPFTKPSIALQNIIIKQQQKQTFESPDNVHFHTHIIKLLQQYTQQWKESFKGTTVDEVCPTPYVWSLTIPSKVYVLHKLLSNTPSYANALRVLMSLLPEVEHTTYDMIRDKLKPYEIHANDSSKIKPTLLQWLHVHAHQHMQALTEPQMINSLSIIHDPILKPILFLWTTYPDFYDYFVPLNVQQKYEEQLHCSRAHTWTWKNKTYSLKMFLPKQSANKKILHHICYRMTMMSLLGKNRCEHLQLKWFPSDCVKRVGCCSTHNKSFASCDTTSKTIIWNPYQINTGATYRNSCKSITIWRREEAAKTFLHEMMHGYGWDFDVPQHVLYKWVTTHFAVNKNINIRFYEGYVETWATILNVYMTVLYNIYPPRNHKKNHTRKSKPIRMMKKTLYIVQRKKIHYIIHQLLQREQQFVMFQVAKVLVNSGFQTWEDFFINHSSRVNQYNIQFSQTTSVFSYFIIRSAHLWNMSWFIQTFPYPDFKSNPSTKQTNFFDIWLNHLEQVYTTSSYRLCVNNYMQLLRSVSNKKDLSNTIQESMRMTCVEVV